MERPDFPAWIIAVVRLIEDEREEFARPLFEQWYGDFLPQLQSGDLAWASGFVYALDDYLVNEVTQTPLRRAWILEEYHAWSAALSLRK